MDFRRTLLWMIFLFSLVMLWDGWNKHLGKPTLFGGPAATKPQSPTGARGPDLSVPTGQGLPDSPSNTASPSGTSVPAAIQPAAAARAETIRVKTDLARIDFSTEGAQVTRFELIEHRDQVDRENGMVLLDDEPGKRVYLAQTGLAGAPAGTSWPTHRTMFRRVDGPLEMADGAQTLDVAFEAESGGVKLRKVFTFTRGRYDVAVRHEIENLGAAPIAPRLYLQITRDGTAPAGETRFMTVYTGPALYTAAGKYRKVSFSDVDKGAADFNGEANEGWIAMIQHYFVTAWIPENGVARRNEALKNDGLYVIRTIEATPPIAPGGSNTVAATLYVGPQNQKELAALSQDLDLVVDYGHLKILAQPIFLLLQWWHSVVGNWGWAVVMLTVTIKAIFYPLSAASYKSMAKMRAVAPRLKRLQEQYKDDRQKLNLAMMEMYKTEKINPLGGCLPMVIQIPVFISLYWVVLAAVEMRGSPWIGWIHDLTSPDPFYILPAIMIATQFLQFKLSPTPADPVQARVMMFMPLVFGGMMVFFPAALVLYWVTNNCLSIAQQWQITRMIEGKPLFRRAPKD